MPPTACKLSLEIGKNDNITSSLDGRQINNTPDEPYYSYSTLLDLSAAFDCVDHDIVVRRLQLAYGIVRFGVSVAGCHHSSAAGPTEYSTSPPPLPPP